MRPKVTIPCVVCGKEIRLSPSHVGRKKYCSRACQTHGGKVEKTCERCGKKYWKFRAYADRSKYCSRACQTKAISEPQTIASVRIVHCSVCDKPFKTYGSKYRGRKTCSVACTNTARGIAVAPRDYSPGAKISGIERRVGAWLDEHGIAYKTQVVLARRAVDFRSGDTIIEVNGCYWHGCEIHFPDRTERQNKRISRDKGLATYCRNRGLTLLVIWEHDVIAENWDVLSTLLDHRIAA